MLRELKLIASRRTAAGFRKRQVEAARDARHRFIQGKQYQIAALFGVELEFGFSVVMVPRYDRSGVVKQVGRGRGKLAESCLVLTCAALNQKRSLIPLLIVALSNAAAA